MNKEDFDNDKATKERYENSKDTKNLDNRRRGARAAEKSNNERSRTDN
jgi:hypothetical protein